MNLEASDSLTQPQNLYEVLDIPPDASPQDIRAAYLRAKASYQRDSLALYSLMDSSDAEAMLRQIEEAFVVLSNPDRRKLYDQSYRSGHTPTASPRSATVTSIDRVPPMSVDAGGDELLIPPSTDFQGTLDSEKPVARQAAPVQRTSAEPPPRPNPPAGLQTSKPPIQLPMKSSTPHATPITSGAELREVRERQGVSIEYLAEITRIRKSYLKAIENEAFEALPAPVFIRGFLHQLARELHVPAEPMVTRYLERYSAWKQTR